jgi:hypothetical protein
VPLKWSKQAVRSSGTSGRPCPVLLELNVAIPIICMQNLP